MNIIIIEDEAPAVRRLQSMIKEILPEAKVLEIFDSVESSINYFQNLQQNTDLVFMDIQLADGLSFEIFEKVSVNFPIIFITAHDEYAIKAFKVNSIDYLLKPIKKEDLQKSIDKFKNFKTNQANFSVEELLKSIKKENKIYKTRFLIKMGDSLKSISEENIAYFQAQDKYVFLVNKEHKKYLIDYSLEDLENCLNDNLFFRLNRQFIAHINSIKSIQQDFNGKLKIFLEHNKDEDIWVSREKSSDFKKWLDGV